MEQIYVKIRLIKLQIKNREVKIVCNFEDFIGIDLLLNVYEIGKIKIKNL